MNEYTSMKEITDKDYREYVKFHKEVIVEDVNVPIGEKKEIKKLQPENFELECTTVWSFPKRGDWATHRGNYRGNWPPQLVRNLILRYSKEGDLVLDQMVGSGTTLVECKLLGRNGIGVDINRDSIMLARDRLNFEFNTLTNLHKTTQRTFIGDARNLDLIEDNSIDLIATHPPYANIISYSKNSEKYIKGDLSYVKSVDEFVKEMKRVAEESYRVLKNNKYCAILIGDTRRYQHFVPISFRVMQAFLDVGFILKEDIIKHQWQCKTTPMWAERSKKFNFLLIMHEHLFVFRKPYKDKKVERKFRESSKWW